MKSIKSALDKANEHKEVDYIKASEAWRDVLSSLEEKHGFVDNMDHLMWFCEGLRKAGFNATQINQLVKIFITSQNN